MNDEFTSFAEKLFERLNEQNRIDASLVQTGRELLAKIEQHEHTHTR